MNRMIGLGAACALLGGALRIIAAFIPYTPEAVWLEGLYATIDLAMLFALIGVYLATSDALRSLGFGFLVIALAALASIVGPDAKMFGIDFYRLGAGVFALALAGVAVQLLRARVMIVAAWLWIASALGSVAAGAGSEIAFIGTGIVLGMGFIAASSRIWQQRKAGTEG